MKKCPYCAEEIQDAAIVCRYCGRDLQPSLSKPEQQVQKPPVKKQSPLLLGIFLIIIVCWALTRGTGGGSTPKTTAAKTTETARLSSIEYRTVTPDPTTTLLTTKTPEPTTQSTDEQSLGKTRDNPYPANAKVDVGSGMQISVIFVERPANQIVFDANMFNDTPEPNQEYILVALRVDCMKPNDEQCHFSPRQLKAVGTNGNVRDNASVASIPGKMEYSNEFFGGGYVEGNVVFLVTKDDPNTVLMYEPSLLFGDPIYMSL